MCTVSRGTAGAGGEPHRWQRAHLWAVSSDYATTCARLRDARHLEHVYGVRSNAVSRSACSIGTSTREGELFELGGKRALVTGGLREIALMIAQGPPRAGPDASEYGTHADSPSFRAQTIRM